MVLSSGGQLYTKYSFEAVAIACAGVILYSAMVLKLDNAEIVKDVMILICIMHIIYVGHQRIAHGLHNTYGLMATPNDASGLLAVCAPACFRRWRWPCLIAWPFGFCVIPSCIGVIGTSAALIVHFWFSGYRFVPFVVCLAAFAAYVKWVDAPGTNRFAMWIMAYKDIMENVAPNDSAFKTWPIGFGPGNWKMYYAANLDAGKYPSDFIRLHNTFLEGFAELGLPWVAAVAGYLSDIWRRFTESSKNEICALVACVLVNCSNSAFKLNMAVGVFILTWLAMLEISLRRGRTNVLDRCTNHIEVQGFNRA
jgi:hypothetical protein